MVFRCRIGIYLIYFISKALILIRPYILQIRLQYILGTGKLLEISLNVFFKEKNRREKYTLVAFPCVILSAVQRLCDRLYLLIH